MLANGNGRRRFTSSLGVGAKDFRLVVNLIILPPRTEAFNQIEARTLQGACESTLCSLLTSNIRFLAPGAVSQQEVVQPTLGAEKPPQHVVPATGTQAAQATPAVIKPRAGAAVVGKMPQWVTGRRLYVVLLTLVTFVLGMFVGERDHHTLTTERYVC